MILSRSSIKSKLAANVDSTSTHPLNIVHETDEGAELRMNFLLDITPDADIELIMDPIAGDRIKRKRQWKFTNTIWNKK